MALTTLSVGAGRLELARDCELDTRLTPRFSAFLDVANDHSTAVPAALRCSEHEWLPHDGVRGGREPVLQRDGTRWHLRWCYCDLRGGPDGVEGIYSKRDAGLEHALRAAAILTWMPSRVLYFHAATLVFDGFAYLLAGSPNAGKSTISSEGGAERVLCNEISVVGEIDGVWWALPSPFWGSGDVAVRDLPAPLRATAVLTQAEHENSWSPIVGAASIAALLPHVGVQARESLLDPALLASLRQLTNDVGCYSLSWHRASPPLAGSPWKP
ncbi:MAG: hypothetical protein ACI81R_001189 [Bradymonadia bacterium]|jgi:hypothetical protein